MKPEELREKDGSEGGPVYVAYQGKVYDVSTSKLWKGGKHMGRHGAGADLSDFLSMAPHGEEVFENFEVVGELEAPEEDELFERRLKLQELYRKYHPHPVLIHTPMGLFPFALIMQVLFHLTGMGSFEAAAFYALVLGTLGMFPAALAGLFSWWINYDLTLTRIFKNKLAFTGLTILVGIPAILIRLMVPEVSSGGGSLGIVYQAGLFLTVPLSTFVAYNGGKITWPS